MGSIGVCYGRHGNNLPSSREVVALYQRKEIGAMRIYNAKDHVDVLRDLKGTNIRLIMDAPEYKDFVGDNNKRAEEWVARYIKPYKNDVNFKYIAVGNEVMNKEDANMILPAMKKIHEAICNAGLQDKIKVSTAVKSDVLDKTYPPSCAIFTAAHMGPIVKFLKQTGAPLLANIYPYFSHADNPRDVGLDFALFRLPKALYRDGRYEYQNLFDAMVDSMYYALEKVGAPNVGLVVSETGWPSTCGVNTTVENARTYNQNLVNHVKKGTPKRPGKLETYIFAMFNENEKPGAETEKHFGLFKPDKTPVYPINFN